MGVRRAHCAGTPHQTSTRRFNGAALVGVRRVAAYVVKGSSIIAASTEPHSWECGEVPLRRIGICALGPRLQRSRTRGSAESCAPNVCPQPVVKLQRSRTRGSAERWCGLRSSTNHSTASTEPHSWECGEESEDGRDTSATVGFNGAALVGVRRGM